MTRNPEPRFIADIQLAVEISGATAEIAEERLEELRNLIKERLGRTTFTRLAGRPSLAHSAIISEVVET